MKRPDQDTLIQLYAQHRTVAALARALGVNRTTVYLWLKHYQLVASSDRVLKPLIKKGGTENTSS